MEGIKKPKISRNKCEQIATEFFEKQQKFKQIQTKFDNAKKKFNNDMEEYFQQEGISSISVDECIGGILTVNRIQKSSVEFNPDKLEKVLSKELKKRVIIKRYEIIDMDALISYLRECGVEPQVFKSFLNISKTVDIKELDKLEGLGKITAKQVQGCYTIKQQNPYFTVSIKKG